jgi:putative ABC transport system permease protein
MASILAWSGIDLFGTILNSEISHSFLLASITGGFMVSVLVVGLISGLYPAIVTSSFHPFKKSITSQSPFSTQRQLKNVFVLGQFVLSITLTIGCLTLLRQTAFLKNFDVGYSRDSVIKVKLTKKSASDFNVIEHELVSNPGIDLISFARVAPVDLSPIFTTENWRWQGLDEKAHTSIYRLIVDHQYLDVFQIPLVAGRFFSSAGTDKDKVVINQTMAQLMKLDDPISQMLSRNDQQFEVIGIVRDFNFQHLSNDIQPLLFMYDDVNTNMFVKTSQPASQTLKQIQKHHAKITDQPFSFTFIEDEYNDLYSNESKITTAISVFTLLTIVLSCIGLIGMITYSTEIKQKEIAVRKVCGAKINEVLILLNKDLFKWFLAGTLISCFVAQFAMNKWLESFANRIGLDWWLFALGAAIILVISIATISWQTWSAAVKNLADVLKYE